MARTLPPYHIPFIFPRPSDGESDSDPPIETRSGNTSPIAALVSSTEESAVFDTEDVDRRDVDPQNCTEGTKSPKEESPISKERNSPSNKKRTLSLKEENSSSTENSTTSPEKENSPLLENKCSSLPIRYSTPAFPPKSNLKSITKCKNKLATRRKRTLCSTTFRNNKLQHRSLKRRNSSSEDEHVSKSKLQTRRKKKRVSPTKNNTLLRRSSKRKLSSPENEHVSKNKLQTRRKKRRVSPTKNTKLRRRSSKRKISTSEKEHIFKKQPKQILEESKSISTVSEKEMHEKTSIDLAYYQPSTSKTMLNKEDASRSFNEDSAISVHDVSENIAQGHSLRSSELIHYDKLLHENITAMSAEEFSENDSNMNYYARNIEKIKNKNFCAEDASEDHISAAGRADETKEDNACIVHYEVDYYRNLLRETSEAFIAEKASTSSKDVSNKLSARDSPQQRYRKKFTKGPNPLGMFARNENLKEKQLNKRAENLRKITLMKTIPEEKSSTQYSGENCRDTSTDNQKMGDSDDIPPKTDKKKSENKIERLRKREEYRRNAGDKRWHKSPGRRCMMENLFNHYSVAEDQWKVRVLPWINSTIPELTFDIQPVVDQTEESGVNLSTMPTEAYYMDGVDIQPAAEVAAEIIIGNTDEKEETVIESIDLGKEIDVETNDETEEETDEERRDQSSDSQPPTLTSSIIRPSSASSIITPYTLPSTIPSAISPAFPSASPEILRSSDQHAWLRISPESQSPSRRSQGENESVRRLAQEETHQERRDQSSGSQPPTLTSPGIRASMVIAALAFMGMRRSAYARARFTENQLQSRNQGENESFRRLAQEETHEERRYQSSDCQPPTLTSPAIRMSMALAFQEMLRSSYAHARFRISRESQSPSINQGENESVRRLAQEETDEERRYHSSDSQPSTLISSVIRTSRALAFMEMLRSSYARARFRISPESQSQSRNQGENESVRRLAHSLKIKLRVVNRLKTHRRLSNLLKMIQKQANLLKINRHLANLLKMNRVSQPPENELLDVQPPGNESSGGQPPANESSGGQPPANESSGGQPSGNESSGGQPPGNESSGGQSPGNESSGGQPPGNESSGGQPPGNESSGGQPSGNASSGGQPPGNESCVQPPENESSTPQPAENESSTPQPPEKESSSIQPPEKESPGIHPPENESSGIHPPENESSPPENDSS